MAKDVLVLCASGNPCREEIACVSAICATFGMATVTEHVVSADDLSQCLAKHKNRKWKYIYLDAHADRQGFGSSDGKFQISWTDFAGVMCEAQCLEEDAILFLACCRGGLRSTASSLFDSCDQIAFVCGPHWKITSYDLPAAFHVLIYNLESRGEEPLTAVKRASKAVGFRFMFYERAEWEDGRAQYLDTILHLYERLDGAQQPTEETPEFSMEALDTACCPLPETQSASTTAPPTTLAPGSEGVSGIPLDGTQQVSNDEQDKA